MSKTPPYSGLGAKPFLGPPPAKADIATAILTNVIEHLVLLLPPNKHAFTAKAVWADLARHDFHFEELLQMGVGFPEIRAYVLLRNSGLHADDKKKLIVDSKGALEYDSIVSALKLLGSKFFNEVQSGSKSASRSKTYDVNAVFEEEQPTFVMDEETAYTGESWDDGDLVYDESDPDAIVCLQFEDSILEALQGDMELAACFNTYMDARKRLQDRNKNRGFWGSSKKVMDIPRKVRVRTKERIASGVENRWHKVQRILESECRKCGQRGHRKAECHLRIRPMSLDPKMEHSPAWP